MEEKKKFLNVGVLKRLPNGGYTIELDNGNLKEFTEILEAHGQKHLVGLDKPTIWEDAKKKYNDRAYPKLQVSVFAPKNGAPDFILGDLCVVKN